MLRKLLILAAALTLGIPAIGLGQQATKFTVRIEIITKPPFTAPMGRNGRSLFRRGCG